MSVEGGQLVQAEAPPAAAAGAGAAGAGRAGGRVVNVDVLRALAALAVLAGHAYALGGRIIPVKAQHWYDVPLITTATGVWLFFAISGYVITRPFVDRLLTGRELPDVVPYALRRALRIYPLYWVALTAVIVIDGAQGTRAWQFPVHYLLLNNLVPGREGALFSVAWTLTLEMLFYIVVPLLAAAVQRVRRLSPERLAAIVVASWAASIVFTIISDLQGDGQTGLWLRESLPSMWQMFCPGILLAIAPHLKPGAWRRWLLELPAARVFILPMLALLVFAAVLGAAAPLRFGVVPYQLLLDASHPLFAIGYGWVLAAAIRARPWHGALLALGAASYGIYLLHAVVLDFLLSHAGQPLVPFKTTGVAPYVVHILLLAAIAVPLALASWRWFERPLIQLGRELGERWRLHAQVG